MWQETDSTETRLVTSRRLLLLFAGLSASASLLPRIDAQAQQPAPAARPTFAYVGSRTTRERNARGEGISVYSVDPATGALSQVQVVKDLVNPSFLAFDQTQQFLYAVHGDFSEITAFRIGSDGLLSQINRQSTEGKNPVHLSVDATNTAMVVANYATGTVAVLGIGPDGALSPVKSRYELPGKPGPHKVEQTSSHPHQVAFDPSRRFIVVPDKALDRVFAFRLEPTGGVALVSQVETREGAGPRHITFHPSSPWAYVVNELDSTVTTYHFENTSGELKPLQVVPSVPEDFTANNRAAEIEISPSGRFVYVSNRGHDSIGVFSVHAETGRLRPVAWEPTRGRMPRFFSIAPGGLHLYAANEATDTIEVFQIDQDTGVLAHSGQSVRTGSPVCIVFRTV